MAKKRTKTYELYTSGPGSPITNRRAEYHSGMWVVGIRAQNIRQAYMLLGKQVRATDPGGVGIVRLANEVHRGFPWHEELRECYHVLYP